MLLDFYNTPTTAKKSRCPCLKKEYHIACNEISCSYHQTWMKFKCITERTKILLFEKRLVDETERGQIAMTTLGMYFSTKHLFKLSSFFLPDVKWLALLLFFFENIYSDKNEKLKAWYFISFWRSILSYFFIYFINLIFHNWSCSFQIF